MTIRETAGDPVPNGRFDAAAAIVGLLLAAVLAAKGTPPLPIAVLSAILVLLPSASSRWRGSVALMLACALLPPQLIAVATDLASGLRRPPEWDFGAFWLHARLAVEGVDFYDAEKVRAVAAALGASPAFLEQGRFWYPPASMLLFLPLGLFEEPRDAFLFWSLAQLVAVAAGCVLLWRRFAGDSGGRGLLTTAAVVLSLAATLTTLRLGQTHFWVLGLALLWLRDSDRFRGGVWLGLAILVKPVALVFALEPLLRRRVRPLTGLAASLLSSSLVAVAAFGFAVTAGYLERGAGAVPLAIYRMPENQSILGLLARHDWARGGASPLTSPVYLGVVIAVVAWLSSRLWRGRSAGKEEEMALLAAAALVLYPQTLDHYAVLLLPAIFALRDSANAISGAAAAAAVLLVALVYQSASVPLVLAASTICCLALSLRDGPATPAPTPPREDRNGLLSREPRSASGAP